MPETTFHKLNFFQKAVLNWNEAQPYNAAHVVKVSRPLETGRLERSLRDCLGRYGLYGFRLDEKGSRFRYEGTEELLPLDVLPSSGDTLEQLRTRLEAELNRPFTFERPALPLRFFAVGEGSSFYLGLIYFHVIADASSIAFLLGDIVQSYESGVVPSIDAHRLYPRARLGVASILRDLFGWLGSIPQDVADVRRAARTPWKEGAPKHVGLLLDRLPGVEATALSRRSRALGVTLNDVFLAALLKSMSPLRVEKTDSHRTKLSVGSIVNTRCDLTLNGGKEFGLFLSSFRVSCGSPDGFGLPELAQEVSRQTRRIKRRRLYLRAVLETALARRLERFYKGRQRERFYAKNYPLAAGLTNIDLAALWRPLPAGQAGGSTTPDYWRAVSTNAAVPLVFSVTTAGPGLNVGVSFSTRVYSREEATGALSRFLRLMREFSVACFLVALLSGPCAAAYKYQNPLGEGPVQPGQALESVQLDPESEKKILALDPERLSEEDVRDVLAKAPAPHVLNIHGGIYPVHLSMISFSEFLIRMGYPERSVRNPKDGAFSYSCYFDARKIAGAVAWHYEREAMRPMIVGHSQGGVQAMKVLYDLAGKFTKSVSVWNARTGKTEKRDTILDPFTGRERPVVGLRVSYATAVGAGGLTRLLPNQWVMNSSLRSVPDSVVDFTGFRMDGDFLGGDLMGVSGVNTYSPNGAANVRNVRLALGHDHVTVPNTKHLSLNPSAREWINRYHPTENPDPGKVRGPATNLLWAADVWYSIKKHWCLELQNLLRHRQGQNGRMDSSVVRRRLLGRRIPARAAH